MFEKQKKTKERITISTYITPEQYDQLYQVVNGRTSISDAVRKIILKFLSETADK
jgi:hypothetical protein